VGEILNDETRDLLRTKYGTKSSTNVGGIAGGKKVEATSKRTKGGGGGGVPGVGVVPLRSQKMWLERQDYDMATSFWKPV